MLNRFILLLLDFHRAVECQFGAFLADKGGYWSLAGSRPWEILQKHGQNSQFLPVLKETQKKKCCINTNKQVILSSISLNDGERLKLLQLYMFHDSSF